MASMSVSCGPDPSPPDPKCFVCDKPTLQKCSTCNEVYYCSVEHQNLNWPEHKLSCGPFRIEKSSVDPSMGKCWVANRDLEAGKILLNEPAAFYGPWTEPDLRLPYNKLFPLVCTPNLKQLLCIVCGCYSGFNQKPCLKRYFCSKCGWPVCGVECEQNPIHAGLECTALSAEVNGSNSYSALDGGGKLDSMIFSYFITTLRGGLLETRNPKMFQEICKLQHTTQVKDTSLNEIFEGLPALWIWICLKSLKISETISSNNLYSKIFRIIYLNSFCVSTFDQSPRDPMEVAMGGADGVPGQDVDDMGKRGMLFVYIKASRLNHSCVPNCSWSIGPAPDYQIRIRTAVPVKKGDELTILYSVQPFHTGLEVPTRIRRSILSSFHGIVCTCPRCADPTELGTYAGAHTCTSCYKDDVNNPGYMLPEVPLASKCPWRCSKCNNTQLYSQVEDRIHEIVQEQMRQESDHSTWDDLRLYSERRVLHWGHLHPNNYCFMTLPLEWFRNNESEREIHDFAEERVLNGGREWATLCLRFYDRALPGINPRRARVLMNLAAILRVKLLKHSAAVAPKKLMEDYKEFVSTSEEALLFYEKDFARPGDQVNFNAQVICLRMLQVKNELPSEITGEIKI